MIEIIIILLITGIVIAILKTRKEDKEIERTRLTPR